MTDIEKIIYDAIRMVAKTDKPERFAQMNNTVFEVAKTALESIPKIHGWVARDTGEVLNFHAKKPFRIRGLGDWGNESGAKIKIPSSAFPELKTESEPVEVELLVHKIV